MMYQFPKNSFPQRKEHASAFSVLEMMVAMFVLIVLLGIIVAITNSVSQTVLWSSSKLDAFASARSAFDLMNRRLSTATLNTYWDYDNPLAPTVYRRKSDLHFLVRQNVQNPDYGQELYFVAPEAFSTATANRSTSGLLNACGFFVHYSDNNTFRPTGYGNARWRYRLMQALETTENLAVFQYDPASAAPGPFQWMSGISNGTSVNPAVTPLADNVIALIVWPRLSVQDDAEGDGLSSNYQYDSRLNATLVPQPRTAAQLPPTVQVTMVTISEGSAIRLNMSSTAPTKIEKALGPNGSDEKFVNTADYAANLANLSKTLSDENIEFQIFNTTVTLREAKWSDP